MIHFYLLNLFSTRQIPPDPQDTVANYIKTKRPRKLVKQQNYYDLSELSIVTRLISDTAVRPEATFETNGAAIQDQDIIGWEYFIRGHLLNLFLNEVDNYCSQNKLGWRFISKTWFLAVIVALFEIYYKGQTSICSAIMLPGNTNNIDTPTTKFYRVKQRSNTKILPA